MNAVAKKLIQVAGLLIVLGVSSTTAPAFCQQLAANPNGLPPCTMDSFVYEAGAHAEDIYGDEGTAGLPPLAGFTKASRINAGIMDTRDQGLTTGHGSMMPDAWGADEFIAPPNGEWGRSGVRNHTSGDNMDGTAPLQGPTGSGSGGNGGVTPVFSGPGGTSPNPNFPPAPGEGYYSIVGCGGEFQGWMNPAEVAIGQTNWGRALYMFYTSSEFIGDPREAAYEISQIQASGALDRP
ncbi:MAG: hypothetical protein JST01_04165 [Cyanobacteria bacterium SZAS TMP-1]|nr:hypothetical protein [Cyanobacteria bacterium SZAS TMP-1]